MLETLHQASHQSPALKAAEQPANEAAQTIYKLFDKRFISKAQIPAIMLKLRIALPDMAAAFKTDIKGFVSEFVQDSSELTLKDSWAAWTYDEMQKLADFYFKEGKTAREISNIMMVTNPDRTYKSVKSFIDRAWGVNSTGYLVDEAVWDLIDQGYTAEDIAQHIGYNTWRSEFTQALYLLTKYNRTNGYKLPIVRYK